MTVHDPSALPPGLPAPVDDGAADHLVGATLPHLVLPSSRRDVDIADVDVLYVYPRTGKPGEAPLPGWDEIPGARGCTPQSCAFRDRHGAFDELGLTVAGLSSQPLEDQLEFAARNAIPYAVIADPELRLGQALRLPTFEAAGHTLYRRLTLVAEEATVVKVFYPVFPPDENAADVLRWLRSR